MKKVVFGTGLLVCGTLCATTYEMISAIHAASPKSGHYFVSYPPFNEVGLCLFLFGIALSIWGLVEKDKNTAKKAILGTGFMICGTLGVLTVELLNAIRIAFYEYSFPFPPFQELGIASFLVGVALNIWGLIESRNKKNTAL